MDKYKHVSVRKGKKTKLGFSLMELVVVIAILAVFTIMLTPALMSYIELSRAQKDTSSLNEVSNAVVIGLSDYDTFDEIYKQAKYNNVSCYIDRQNESGLQKIITSQPTASYEQYTFGDEAREANRTVYHLAGHMYGVTITFEPQGDKDNRYYDVGDGIVNKYIDGEAAIRLKDCEALYNSVRRTIGKTIDLDSQTYKNSEYTVFIRFSIISSDDFFAQDSVVVYGQYGGTNLGQGPHTHDKADDRGVDSSVGGADNCVHNVAYVSGSEANCGYDGLTDGSYCTICGAVIRAQSKIPATGDHVWRVVEDGTKRVCDVCGRTEKIKDPHVHNYQISTVAATCINKGSTIYTCYCGDSYTETNIPINPDNHEGTPTKKLTKKNECLGWTCCGVIYKTNHRIPSGSVCLDCGYDSLSDHVHNYVIEFVDTTTFASHANCQSPAKYYKTCSCGAKGTETFESGSKNSNNHVGEEKKWAEANKCMGYTCCLDVYTTKHSMYDGQCTLCGYKADHVHAYNEQIATEPHRASYADCQSAATYYYSCECGANGTMTFSSGGYDSNNHIGTQTLKLAEKNKCMGYTCCPNVYTTQHDRDESNDDDPCKDCGYKPTHVHAYNVQLATAEYQKSEATCQSKATYAYSCSCGAASDTKQFEAGDVDPDNHTGREVYGGTQYVHTKWNCCDATISADHSYSNSFSWNSNCSEMDVYNNCACKYSYWVKTITSIYQHNISSGKCNTKGTYDCYAYYNGVAHYCPYTHTGSENPNNHEGGYEETKKTATCNEAGYYQKKCLACGKNVEYVEYDLDKTNHVGETATQQTTEGTCRTEGQKTTTCKSCDGIIKVESTGLVPGNHQDPQMYEFTAPTCTADGYNAEVCNACEQLTGNGETVAKLGHDYDYDFENSDTCMTICTRCTYESAGGHTWSGNTCYKTCTKCDGKKADHNYSYAYYDDSSCKGTCKNAGCTSITFKGHSMNGVGGGGINKCKQVCTDCQYSKYNHSPGAEATCESPQTCTVCATTLKAALGHDIKSRYVGPTKVEFYCTKCDYSVINNIGAGGS